MDRLNAATSAAASLRPTRASSGPTTFEYTVAPSPDGLEATATVTVVVDVRPPSSALNLRSDAIATVAGQNCHRRRPGQ